MLFVADHNRAVRIHDEDIAVLVHAGLQLRHRGRHNSVGVTRYLPICQYGANGLSLPFRFGHTLKPNIALTGLRNLSHLTTPW